MVGAVVPVQLGDIVELVEVGPRAGEQQPAAGCQGKLSGDFGLNNPFVGGKVGKDAVR